MRNLNFEIEGQKLKKNGDFSGIIAGTKNYLRCIFSFVDPDWDNMGKVAVFNDSEIVPIRSNMCLVPNSVSDSRNFKFYVVGKNGNTIVNTNKILIEQVVNNGS